MKTIALEKIERFNRSTFPQEYKMELRTAVKSLIPYDEPTQVANITEVTDTLETICPNSDIVVASRRKQMEVEFYLNLPNFLHPLAEDHEQRKRFGNTHVFYKNNIDGKPVYCNDETKVEKITKYINQVNENKVNEMSDFADILQKCISSRSLDPLEGYIATKHDNNLKNNYNNVENELDRLRIADGIISRSKTNIVDLKKVFSTFYKKFEKCNGWAWVDAMPVNDAIYFLENELSRW